jgi:deazaflavin-dependent oxidoreductase (nitroreductase family)
VAEEDVHVCVSAPWRWLVRHVVSSLNIWLSHHSKGQLSFTGLLGFPVLILTTKGVRTGILRETPLIYVKSSENVAVIASSLGSTIHPQWYRNLFANPVASLSFDGRQGCATLSGSLKGMSARITGSAC